MLWLQSLVSYPSVSLLLTTTPGPRLQAADAARLDRLADQARERVAGERRGDVAAVLDALEALVRGARHAPARRALALFAFRGGWVALLEDGALPGGARVALTLRR